jgi:para-aminobenzoate synthetase
MMTYTLSTRTVTLHRPSAEAVTLTLPGGETFWAWLNDGQQALAARVSGSAGGFRGGWIGWFTYEMKEESLAGYRRPLAAGGARVDAVWAWADRLVERTEDGEWRARGVVADSGEFGGSGMLAWLQAHGVRFGCSAAEFEDYAGALEAVLSSPAVEPVTPAAKFPTFRPRITGEEHMARIDACREAIRQGESYELNQTTSFLATADADAYATYLRLRSFNPAYYSTFISFPCIPTPKGLGLHVLSSSPERFLQIRDGEIEMRPIKGTRARVRPGQCVCVPGVGCGGEDKGSEACRAEAEREDVARGKELSEDLKERAENLMVS